MRTSTSSLAVIRRPGPDGLPRYLAQWNDGWKALNLVGGHKGENESHRACLVRELCEELGVVPDPADPDAPAALQQHGPRCEVAAQPLGRLEYEAYSQSAGERSLYQVELYEVALSAEAVAHVESSPVNRWLSDAEIEAGRCADGMAISDTLRQHWGWLRRHEPALVPVYWLIAAEQRTREAMSEQLAGAAGDAPFQVECDFVGKQLRQLFPEARAFIIRDRLEGLRRKTRPHKLMVEVVGPSGELGRTIAPAPGVWCCRETHLVKIGGPDALE